MYKSDDGIAREKYRWPSWVPWTLQPAHSSECTIGGIRRSFSVCHGSRVRHETDSDLGVCFGILRWPSECGRKERGALGSECEICLQVSCLMHSFEDPQQ